MTNFHFTCPHCSHGMELSETLLGKQGKCPACREVVLVTKTNCSEQVPLGRSDTKSRVVELEGSLAEVLFAEGSPAKATAPLNQIWEEQRQLNNRMEATQSILDRLETVLPEVENCQNAHRNATKQLKRIETDIAALEQELGQAAIQGVLAGSIARKELFEDRIALQQRLAELETQKAEIGGSAKADWKDNLKSKSQSVKVAVQIKVEALKVGGLDKAIGQTLLTDGIEETMRCSETSPTLDRVCIKRTEQTHAVEVETAARIGFSDILQTASAIAQTSSFESATSVKSEIKTLKRQLNEIGKLLAKNRSVMLEAASDDETIMRGAAVGAQLTELGNLKKRLEETKPGISSIAKIASTGWGQISRRRKSVAFVAITLSLVGIVWIWANKADVGQLELSASKTNSTEETDSQATGSPATPRSSLPPSAPQGRLGSDAGGNSRRESSFDATAAKAAAAKQEAARVAAAKRQAARVAAEKERNSKLTNFERHARDFSAKLTQKGQRMTLGMRVADFRNKFPDVVLQEPTSPDIPKDAGVWFFVETPRHLEYEQLQGSFVKGRLFQLRKTYGAGNFVRLDRNAVGRGDVGKGLVQLMKDIGDAYGIKTVTKTSTTANGETVIHREFSTVHIHIEVQLDRRGKIHVSAKKLDINLR